MKPYYERGGVTIFHGDCREILPTLHEVDVVITDPPYSERVHSKARRGSELPDAANSAASFSRAKEFGFDCMGEAEMREVSAEFARLCKRWVLVFSDAELNADWRRELMGAGLEHVRVGAWVKLNPTPQFTGDRPAPGFEAVEIAHPKGRKRWNGGGKAALWQVPIEINRGGHAPRLHTTQKPYALMSALVAQFTEPKELILDPYCGSGTTLVAAKWHGRRAIGCDISERNCEISANRLAQGTLEMSA